MVNGKMLAILALPLLPAATIRCVSPGRPIAAERPKDNQACLDCHASFHEEPIVVVHGRTGQLCIDCHGASTRHLVGSEPQAKPDVVFTRADVTAFCSGCHDPAAHPERAARRFIEKWQGRQRPNGRTVAADSICTDCHGVHVMPAKGHNGVAALATR